MGASQGTEIRQTVEVVEKDEGNLDRMAMSTRQMEMHMDDGAEEEEEEGVDVGIVLHEGRHALLVRRLFLFYRLDRGVGEGSPLDREGVDKRHKDNS